MVPRIDDEMQGVDSSRAFLAQVWIDQDRCARLIECLDAFRKEWDDRLGVWKDRARHDEYSHGYKSLETYALAHPLAPTATPSPLRRDLRWVV